MDNALLDVTKFDLADLGNLFRTKPADLPDQDLLALDFLLHRAWLLKRAGGRVHFGPKSWSYEDMVNLHAFVKAAMSDRGFKHTADDELDKATERLAREQAAEAAGTATPPPGAATTEKAAGPGPDDLAPVHPSGNAMGPRIHLRDVLAEVKSFYPHPVFAWLVGGLASWGSTTGDIDVLWWATDELPGYLRKILEFRFGRQFADGDTARRVQHHLNVYQGPFTSAVPVYALKVERINAAGEVKRADADGAAVAVDLPLPDVPGPVDLVWCHRRQGWTLPADWAGRYCNQAAPAPVVVNGGVRPDAAKSVLHACDHGPALVVTAGPQVCAECQAQAAARAAADETAKAHGGTISDTDALTPVERHAGVWLKRDDAFAINGIRGGKVRTCWTLAQGAPGLVTAGSRSSPQVAIVARVAEKLGIPARCHVPQGPDTPVLVDARKHGATIVRHAAGYNNVIIARARADAEKRGLREVPFGMETPAAVDATRRQVVNIPAGAKRLVVPVGSGMSLAGILWGLLEAKRDLPVLGVVVGADPRDRLDRYGPKNWRKMVRLVQARRPYDTPADEKDLTLDGVGLDAIYEAKCVRYLQPDDCLWVVGIRPTQDAPEKEKGADGADVDADDGAQLGDVLAADPPADQDDQDDAGQAQPAAAKSAACTAVVISRRDGAQPGTWHYTYGLDFQASKVQPGNIRSVLSKLYLAVGETAAAAVDLEPGDTVQVQHDGLTLDRTGGLLAVSAAGAVAVGVGNAKRSMTVGEAAKAARDAGVLVEKPDAAAAAVDVALSGADDMDPDPYGGLLPGGDLETAETAKAPFAIFGQFTGQVRAAVLKVLGTQAHKLYVEAFTGPAQFLHSKDPSEREVIADKDARVVGLHRTIQALTDADLDRLATYKWGKLGKEEFRRLTTQQPYTDPVRELWRTLVVKRNSIGSGIHFTARTTYRTEPIQGFRDVTLARLRKARARLKAVKINEADFGKTLRDHDSPDTLFIVDPPYLERDSYYGLGFTKDDMTRLCRDLSKLRGRFVFIHTPCKTLDLPKLLPGAHSRAYSWVSRTAHLHPNSSKIEANRQLLVFWNFGGPETVKALDAAWSAAGASDVPDAPAGGLVKAELPGPYGDNPDEGKRYRYVVQAHWRGRTVHHDLRLQTADPAVLIGWTLASEIAGVVKDPVETAADAARWSKSGDAYKVDFTAGQFKDRRNAAGNVVPAQLRAFAKALQPAVWLDVEGVTPPYPAPGSTREFRGVFHVDDSGQVEYGAQKRDTHEYYLHGKLRGRLLLRRLRADDLARAVADGVLVPDDDTAGAAYACGLDADALDKVLPPATGADDAAPGGTLWTAIKPLDQRPLVLSTGEVGKGWVPPAGVSALPAAVRKLVPPAHRYWTESGEAARVKARDALVAALADGSLSMDFNALLGPRAR